LNQTAAIQSVSLSLGSLPSSIIKETLPLP